LTKKLQHTIPDFQQQFVQSKMALTQGFDPNIEYKNTTEFWKNEKLPNTKESAEKEPAKNKHQLEYEENVRKPAGKTYLPSDFKEGELTEIIPGRAWVLPNVLTPEECSDWILRGQKAGMNEAKQKLRSSKRTSYYVDASMSAAVKPKLTQELISNVEKSDPGTEFKGVHTNWRIAEYQKGCTFPAHYDQDSFNILPPNEEGVRERETSSHTILLYLSKDFEGGATRFFPTGDFKNVEDTIDVRLPQGGMLIFEQIGLLHNGMEVKDGVKYIAQSALVRAQPKGLIGQPSLFRWGPGLKPY